MEALNRFDTVTDTLPNGERRCDSRYKDFDEQTRDSEWARCIRPAALRVRVTSDTALPNQVFEAVSCRECYAHVSLMQGKQGYDTKVESDPAL